MLIGSRGSSLALAQAEIVRTALEDLGIAASVKVITTAGDRRAPDTPWGEGAFVTAIEEALLAGDVDIAVHSAKDVPTQEDARLTIAAFLPRASPRDVLVMRPGVARASSIDELPHGARVGTDSPRRTAFLRAVRPDFAFHRLHGNVDTRLRRLDEDETDVLVLAEAGLVRLGRDERISVRLDPEDVPPAPGQGALAVQVRAADGETARLVARLDDAHTRRAVLAERALLSATGGGCRASVGALGQIEGGNLSLLAGYARADGKVRVVARHAASSQGGQVGDAGRAGDGAVVQAVLMDLLHLATRDALRAGGPRILVTRPPQQAAPLMLALVDRGMAPIGVPTIEIEPVDEGGLAATASHLDDFDWVVLTSANAARALLAAARTASIDLAVRNGRTRWAAVGPATARELIAAGIQVDFQPVEASGSALAETLPIEPGHRALMPRSDIAEPKPVARLESRGASVTTIVAYRTVEAPPSSVPLLGAALGEDPAGVVFTSGSAARGLATLADSIGAGDRVRALTAICIGAETAHVARGLGFTVVVAPGEGPDDLADAAEACMLRPVTNGTTPIATAP